MQGTRARLTIQTARGKPPDSNEGIQTPFRLIHYISPKDQHEYHFITCNASIRANYRGHL